MRGVSTVVDASLCLLLVSASALVLSGPPTADGTPRQHGVAPASADETAELLATATARVNYSVDGRTRTAHDTLAGLLASAVDADVRTAAPGASSTFAEAVIGKVNRQLGRLGVGVRVVARAPPGRVGPDESPAGRLAVGPASPPDADVHAAEFVVREVRLAVRTWSA
ncbi:DUF7284 family protein [Halorussus halobius]|uniref:DUF7284 family protein n=1 Tax=Halorussus halobius TaxID=1710537 RepID=UPI00143CD924|nr:hypothetical protein [Halorussus halobius]